MTLPTRLELPEIAAAERDRRAGIRATAIREGKARREDAAADAALWDAIVAWFDGSNRLALDGQWASACVVTRRAARSAMAAHVADMEDRAAGDRALHLARLAGSLACTAEALGHEAMVDAYLAALTFAPAEAREAA